MVSKVPTKALPYQRALTSNVRFVWGLNGPVATMAAQVHQESTWNANAKSLYAGGLAQFTPATATWISQKYPDLVSNQPFEPAWAFRALTRYDKFLYERQSLSSSPCDRWAFTLSSYNGGEENLTKDKKLTVSKGEDPTKWFGSVEKYSGRAPQFLKENRAYPRRILLTLQPIYLGWGPGIECNL